MWGLVPQTRRKIRQDNYGYQEMCLLPTQTGKKVEQEERAKVKCTQSVKLGKKSKMSQWQKREGF